MASRRNVQYSRLADDDDDYYGQNQHDPRFDYTPRSYDKVPWKSIFLALFLLLLGCLLLLLAIFIFTDHMRGELSQAYGLLGLGLLTFLPGILKASLYCYLITFVRSTACFDCYMVFCMLYVYWYCISWKLISTLTEHIPNSQWLSLYTYYYWMIVGFYETRIAYYSWRGAQGYRFANIPDYWGLCLFPSLALVVSYVPYEILLWEVLASYSPHSRIHRTSVCSV